MPDEPAEQTMTLDRMRLACRAATLTNNEGDLLESARMLQLKILLGVPLVVAAGVAIGRVSLAVVLPLAAVAALFMFLRSYWKQRTIDFRVLAWPAILAAVRLAAVLLESRLVASAVLAGAVLFLFWRYAAEPLAIYQEWLFTDPKLRGKTRAALAVEPVRPTLWVLVVFLAAAVILPWRHSTTLALVCLILLTVGFLLYFASTGSSSLRQAVGELLLRARQVRLLYLAYPDQAYARPGVWVPNASLTNRRRNYLAITIPLYVTLLVTLSFCCPWEIFASWTLPKFTWSIPPHQAGEHAYEWILYPFLALANTHSTTFLWSFVVALPMLMLLPPAILFVSYLPSLQRLGAISESVRTLDTDDRTQWEQYVDRLSQTRDLGEAGHLFMGFFAATGAPVLLDRDLLGEHAYIVGQSGSGKTALGLIPLLIQLIRGQKVVGEDETGNPRLDDSPPSPVVILDLKGDLALFNTVKLEAARRGQPFRFFSMDSRNATHVFDPFVDIRSQPRSVIEICELIIQSLNLYHGEHYGASYYSRQHRECLLTVLEDARENDRMPNTWAELMRLIKFKATGRNKVKDATELLSVVHALSCYDQLTLSGKVRDENSIIQMSRVISENQVVYFWLPARINNMSIREVGKLAVFCLLTAAADYHESGQPRKQVYLAVDEFQEIVGENIRVVLQQARGFGVSIILANQDPKALHLPNMDLRSAVMTNTRCKQYFTVTSPDEIREVMLQSGDTTDTLLTETFGERNSTTYGNYISTGVGSSHSMAQREIRVPRLQVNEIISTTDAPQDSILMVTRGSRYTQLGGIPTRIRTPWPISLKEYKRRLSTPWPSREEAPGLVIPSKTPDDQFAETRQLFNSEMAGVLEAKKKDESIDGPPGADEAEKPKKGRGGRRPKKT